MDRINKHNFEAYFLDYHEGRLSPEEEKAVMVFIQDNPECFDAFEDYDSVVLPIPDVSYPDKSELFRSEVSMPEADEWEFLCISYMEGDLSGEELADFELKLEEDQEKKTVLNSYLNTKSLPDEEIVFVNKGELKKKAVLIPRWIYGAVSAAAVLILGWIIVSPFGNTQEDPVMAETEERDIIYLDKLEHPGVNEKIASTDNSISRKLKSSSVFNIVQEESGLMEIEPPREDILMASLDSHKPTSISSGYSSIPNSTNVFAYRSIPGVEDEEYKTLLAFTGEYMRMKLLNQDPELVGKSKFSLWELADAGLEKISSTFGMSADIEREYSEEGELLAVSFESPLVGFNTPIRKRSAQSD